VRRGCASVSFTEGFYAKLSLVHLQPVLETLEYLARQTKVWLEVTTLLLPGHNDGDAELEALAAWIAERLGRDVPLHFSAFHPDHQLRGLPPTPPGTLVRARAIAARAGLRYVYGGNVRDPSGEVTRCPRCASPLVRRDWFELREYRLTREGRCPGCGAALPGRSGEGPGPGERRRIPILPTVPILAS
jgi:pyruvate formate lyase activating enzyme